MHGISLGPLQLVEVAGSNMWVMKETGGPSSEPPPTGHLRQKVHAQQSTARSLERITKLPQATGMTCISSLCVTESVTSLSYLSGVVRNMCAVIIYVHS